MSKLVGRPSPSPWDFDLFEHRYELRGVTWSDICRVTEVNQHAACAQAGQS